MFGTCPAESKLGRKLCAAFEAAAFQHGSAGTTRHPFHETMFTRALPFLWLIGSFWHILYSSTSLVVWVCCLLALKNH
jgi:hypothetical protein